MLAQAAGGTVVGDVGTSIRGIVHDSRRVAGGFLFAALRGADDDGHDFADQAVARGAAALLVERPLGLGLPEIVVADSRAALAPVAAAFYDHPSWELTVVGITGTDGKTTTSALVESVLGAAGVRTGVIGTVGVRVGERVLPHETRQTTPESDDLQGYLRQMADDGAGAALLEATSHGLAMHRLDALQFRVGAVTNITHEHIDYHGTVDAYRRAKGTLFERVGAEGGVAVINADDAGARAMVPFAAGARRVILYSAAGDGADLRAREIAGDLRGSKFVLEEDGRRARVMLPLLGAFNVENALCAAGIGLALGLDLLQVRTGLEATPPVPGRMAPVVAGQPFTVVVDYAHTPEALAKVLTLLRELNPRGRVIAVFGSAGERDIEKRGRQGAVAVRLADFTVLTSEDPRHEDPDAIVAAIAVGAEAVGARQHHEFVCVTDRAAAIRLALGAARPGDCVLLAGKGHETSMIWGREQRPWDEDGVAREALWEMGYRESENR